MYSLTVGAQRWLLGGLLSLNQCSVSIQPCAAKPVSLSASPHPQSTDADVGPLPTRCPKDVVTPTSLLVFSHGSALCAAAPAMLVHILMAALLLQPFPNKMSFCQTAPLPPSVTGKKV